MKNKRLISFFIKLELVIIVISLLSLFEQQSWEYFFYRFRRYFVYLNIIGTNLFILKRLIKDKPSDNIVVRIFKNFSILMISTIVGTYLGFYVYLYVFWVENYPDERFDILKTNFLLTVVILGLYILFDYYKYKIKLLNEEKEKESIKSKLNTLQSRLNPHFLFNILNTILAIGKKNNYNKLEKAINNLANIYRKILKLPENVFITIEKEMEIIKDYLEIEKLRLEERLNYNIDIEDSILDEKILSFMIEIPVENSVIHGISKKKEGGTVDIIVKSLNKNKLNIKIKDTGVGIKDYNKKGFGLYSLEKRLNLIYEEDVEFKIKSLKEGTLVDIIVPKKYSKSYNLEEKYEN